MGNLEFIDDYFQGLLTDEGKLVFQKKMIEEPSFAEDVAFYLSVQKVSLEQLQEDKKAHFRDLYNHNKPRPAIFQLGKNTWAYSAAAVLISLIIGIYLVVQPPASQQLAEKYIKDNFETLGLSMDNREDKIQKGLQLYNDGKLEEASKQFEMVLMADSSNFIARRYAGIAELRLKNYATALKYFHQLEADSGLRSNPGKFYLALTLLKRNNPNDKEEAKRLLLEVSQKNLTGKQTAEQWLKQF
jgi:hypothetical protein